MKPHRPVAVKVAADDAVASAPLLPEALARVHISVDSAGPARPSSATSLDWSTVTAMSGHSDTFSAPRSTSGRTVDAHQAVAPAVLARRGVPATSLEGVTTTEGGWWTRGAFFAVLAALGGLLLLLAWRRREEDEDEEQDATA